MKKLQDLFIAWLRKQGFKPHYSNITHFNVGYIIGLIAGVLSFIVLGLYLQVVLAIVIAGVIAFVAALAAGYWKECKDGANFDVLDLWSTAAGGLLAGATIIVFYYVFISLILNL